MPSRTHLFSKLVVIAALAMGATAQTYYWDGADTTADADGGAGAWDAVATNWDDAATAGNAVAFTGGQNAVFGAPGGVVTVGSALNAGTVTFNAAGYTIDLGANAMTWATLAGTGGFTKAGAATLTLSGASTASGTVTISAGRITLGDNAALGTSAIDLNGGTLERNAGNITVTNAISVGAAGGTLLGRQVVDAYTLFSGPLSGSGALTVQGLVNLNNAANTHTGSILISNASATYLRLSGSELLGNLSAVTLGGANARLRLDGGSTETIGSLAGSGDIFVSNMGVGLAGTVKFGGDNASTSYTGTLTNNDGQLFLVKQGTGTFTLAPGNSAYQGLTVSKGTVLATNANGGAGPAVTLGDADTGGAAAAFLTTASGAARNIIVSANGSGTATIGSTTGAGAGNVVFSGAVTLNRAATITAASTDRTTWTGKISGPVGTLTIAGGQRTVFDNTTNDFTGSLDITGANTVLQTGVGTGSEHIPNGSSVNVGAGAFLKLAGTAATTETIDALTGTGTVRRHEGVGGLVTLILGSAGGSGSFGGTFQNGAGTLAVVKTGAGTQAFSGVNAHTGGTTVRQGVVEVSNGSALGTGAGQLGDASTGAASVALYLANARTTIGNTITVSNLAGGSATLGSRASITGAADNNQFTSIVLQRDVVFDSNAADRTDYENISGAGNITVTGAGRTIFATNNSFAGNVTVSVGIGGTLQIGAATAVLSNYIPDTGNLTVNDTPGGGLAEFRLSTQGESVKALLGNGTIDVNSISGTLTVGAGGGSGTFSGQLVSGGGGTLSLAKAGAGTQILSGNNSYAGATTINGGVLQIGNGGTTGTLGAGPVTDNAALVINRSDAVNLGASISGSGTLTQAGTGTTTLAAANTYAGTTYVTQGALILDGTTVTTGRIDVSAGATLGGGGIGGITEIAGGATFAPGGGDNEIQLASLTLSGAPTLEFEVDTPSETVDFWNDHVLLDGDLALNGVLKVFPRTGANNFDFTTAVAGDKWRIMTYSGNLSGSGLTVASGPALAPGLVYQVDTSTAGAVYLTVAVPEAGTGALALAGLLLLLRRGKPARRPQP